MRNFFEIHDGDVKVIYNDSPEVRDKVFERVLQYYKDNDCGSGESLHQNDDCIINAPDVLSDILDDILEAETEYQDE